MTFKVPRAREECNKGLKFIGTRHYLLDLKF
jgi:hypothetical protein